ncbi:MAG TPA: DUF5946 family protein [Patescibacteria group bacterium]
MNYLFQDAFNELSYYTLSHEKEEFIHQYIVDAFAAQMAEKNTKKIAIAFGLIGLYLHLEKEYSGKMVQNAHMRLAKYKDKLPEFVLPKDRGDITVFDVLNAPDEKRHEKIEEWMVSVWEAYKGSHKKVEEFINNYL